MTSHPLRTRGLLESAVAEVDIHATLAAFYVTVNPEKLQNLPTILRNFAGNEAALLRELQSLYSIGIAAFLVPKRAPPSATFVAVRDELRSLELEDAENDENDSSEPGRVSDEGCETLVARAKALERRLDDERRKVASERAAVAAAAEENAQLKESVLRLREREAQLVSEREAMERQMAELRHDAASSSRELTDIVHSEQMLRRIFAQRMLGRPVASADEGAEEVEDTPSGRQGTAESLRIALAASEQSNGRLRRELRAVEAQREQEAKAAEDLREELGQRHRDWEDAKTQIGSLRGELLRMRMERDVAHAAQRRDESIGKEARQSIEELRGRIGLLEATIVDMHKVHTRLSLDVEHAADERYAMALEEVRHAFESLDGLLKPEISAKYERLVQQTRELEKELRSEKRKSVAKVGHLIEWVIFRGRFQVHAVSADPHPASLSKG